MTEFRKLAEMIAEDIGGAYYLCQDLPKKQAKYITKYFKPSFDESMRFNHFRMLGDEAPWLSSINTSRQENNSFRILILLMAEQHYLTYNKS